MLELSERFLLKTEYVVENKSEKNKVLLIEHPIEPQYSLVETPAPMEKTDAHYRFRYELGAKETQPLLIQMEWVRTRKLALVDELAATLQIFTQSTNVPPKVAAAIEEAMRRRRSINDLEQQITVIETQVTELTKEQSRLRENLKTAPGGNQYHNRLLSKLNEQEDQFEKLQNDLDALRQRRDAANKELGDYVAGLTLRD